jgi:hypothetical protein
MSAAGARPRRLPCGFRDAAAHGAAAALPVAVPGRLQAPGGQRRDAPQPGPAPGATRWGAAWPLPAVRSRAGPGEADFFPQLQPPLDTQLLEAAAEAEDTAALAELYAAHHSSLEAEHLVGRRRGRGLAVAGCSTPLR